MLASLSLRLAQALEISEKQIIATLKLLDEGATVPFIARYRKEATGGLDDTQLRHLAEKLEAMRELDARREVVLKSIREQNQLTPELEAQIFAADNKTRLEDLYLPYKPKRRTKAQIAREAGLEPLALSLLQQPELDPEQEAAKFINDQILDSKAALDGARAILMEHFAQAAELLGVLREKLWQNGVLRAQVIAGKEASGQKFRDYFDYCELLRRLPSHRFLALLRGRNEDILQLSLLEDFPSDEAESGKNTISGGQNSIFEQEIARFFQIENKNRAADAWLLQCVRLAWRAKIFLSLETELLHRAREAAEGEAIDVFARNLKDLLLAAPAGARATMGLDPGIRTGVKVAVIDATGKLLTTTTIFPHEPRQDWEGSIATLDQLAQKYGVELIAIGNGTASRETDQLVADWLKRRDKNLPKIQKIVVSEAGASIYSASALAAEEFPDLDVSLRGAVSIARRLQDPLAELVKIEPKSIGVGQYQHDVNQTQLARSLDAVVEDCVNAVGVDVNTASASLLARISGLNKTLAQNIVAFRDAHGAFADRRELLNVPRLGEKTFEQAAGFLRILQGRQPLDASAVHPEAYPLVESILAHLKLPISAVLGQSELLKNLSAGDFTTEQFGLPTVRDILRELDKPARDPRGEFKTAQFDEAVQSVNDLRVGMILEGVVSNVANFGAFVNIGVDYDGLVHISAMSSNFVKNVHDVVRAGQLVKVKVIDLDLARQRIHLSMRLDDEQAPTSPNVSRSSPKKQKTSPKSSAPTNAMSAAFAKLKVK